MTELLIGLDRIFFIKKLFIVFSSQTWKTLYNNRNSLDFSLGYAENYFKFYVLTAITEKKQMYNNEQRGMHKRCIQWRLMSRFISVFTCLCVHYTLSTKFPSKCSQFRSAIMCELIKLYRIWSCAIVLHRPNENKIKI